MSSWKNEKGMMMAIFKVTLLLFVSFCSCLAFWTPTLSPLFVIRQQQTHIIQSYSDQVLSSSLKLSASSATEKSYWICDSNYADLNDVSVMMVDGFYNTTGSPWKQLYRLAELNRLQNNFPYNDIGLHQMFVAVANVVTNNQTEADASSSPSTTITTKVVGFCDIDARPCYTKPILPRPYLSDLVVHHDFRRQGIAKALIQQSEEFIRNIPRKELFIRVQAGNAAAVSMYEALNYEKLPRPETERDESIILLHKELD